ncbi:ABC transporter substrate-binding protein [Lentisalinibacter orientalis]|uniref:ABC transporter substrate-binding protein n=1 Tax=Lentisalinibacter orientalis TaxID=2992241 RepID=UPI00386AF9E7
MSSASNRVLMRLNAAIAASVMWCALSPAAADIDVRDWDEVQQKAKGEGTVVVAGPAFPNLRDAIVEQFEKDTGIKVEWRPLTRGPGPFIAQFAREAEADRVQTDVYIGGSTNCYTMNRLADATVDLRNILMDPSVTDPSAWRHGELSLTRGGPNRPHYHWCALNTAEWVMGDLFVNTRYVDPADITSWRDLLRPEYRGKIAAHDPRHPGGGRGTAAYLFQLFGEKFLNDLFIGQDVTMYRNYTQAAEDVARGKAWIGIALVQAAVEPLRERGLPLVRIYPKDGPGLLTGGFGGIMKLKDSPNPHAGTVFINWWASRQGQEVAQCELMELSLRTDVNQRDCVPEWIIPRDDVEYEVHSYAPDHYFRYYLDYVDRVGEIYAD